MGKPVIQIVAWGGKANQGLQPYLSQQGFNIVVSDSRGETLYLFQKARLDLAIIDSSGDIEDESLTIAKLYHE